MGASGHDISGAMGGDGLCAGEGQEGFLLNVLRLAPGMVAICAALQGTPAIAQGNIDAGKSPAQIFADTCSACHRSAREFQRISASFLRTHYTAGSDEASAMASYLVGIANNEAARPSQPKRPPAEVGRQQPLPTHQQPSPRHPPEQAKAAQGQPKGRQGATAQAVRPAAAEERPAPEPLPPPPPASAAPPAPVLEPFEE